MDNTLAILIPTYNRQNYLYNCVQSILSIYGDSVQIIIGNSGEKFNIEYEQRLKKLKNLKIIDTSKYERNLVLSYSSLLDYTQAEYILYVDDDDILVNKQLHNKIFNILKKKTWHCISFAGTVIINGKQEKYLIDNFQFSIETKQKIPQFWNGEFQFGNIYLRRSDIKNTYLQWYLLHPESCFDISHDEVAALGTIYNTNSYFHINEVGIDLGIQEDNVSWNNLMRSIYSSSTYIEDLKNYLHESNTWKYSYEQIQLKELQTMCSKLTYTDVFDNTFYKNLRQSIKNKIIQGQYTYKQIYDDVIKKLEVYKCLKKYTINNPICLNH